MGNVSDLNYHSSNLKDRYRLIGGAQRCLNYVWTFKLRCVDENNNPLGDNQCKIRTCAVKRLYARELGVRTKK